MIKKRLLLALTVMIIVVTLPLKAQAQEIMTAEEFQVYLNETYSSIETSVGTLNFTHTVYSSRTTNILAPHKIWIKTKWNPLEISPYDIKYGLDYTNNQKKEIVRAWQTLQEKIYADAKVMLGNPRMTGGFHYGYYKYPTLQIEWRSTSFLTWTNYIVDFDYWAPEDSEITDDVFNWDFSIDDYDFTNYMKTAE